MASPRYRHSAAFLSTTLISCLSASAINPSPTQPMATITEKALRLSATLVVTPEFPPKALALHQFGVAVAKVIVAPSGIVKTVTVVRSPGNEVSDSMIFAIRKWKFQKADSNLFIDFSGKITYYFVLHNGHPTVYSATESFYVGPQTSSSH